MKTEYYCLLEDNNNFTKPSITHLSENKELDTKVLENTVLELADLTTWTNSYIFYKAMKLAFFLIPVKEVAAQVTQEAINLAKIKSAERKGHRRRFFANKKYQEGGGPTGLLMHENQFVQAMVYQEIEKYEKYQEGSATTTDINLIKSHAKNKTAVLLDLLSSTPVLETDWIIRYLKTIVQISNNNSPDLITAITRLVCDFQSIDVSNLYVFFGGKGTDPNYFSKRKLLLMNKLKKRFPFLEICKIEGKRTFFYGQEQVNSKWSNLVETFFTQIIPWGTRCNDLTKHDTSFIKAEIRKLINMFRKNYIFEEDHKQMSYLHAIVCPDCFINLISAVKLDCPRERLALPKFLSSNNNSSNNFDDDSEINNGNIVNKLDRNLKLTEEQLDDLTQSSLKYLSIEAERRENIKIEKIGILLDGQQLPILIDKQEESVWDLTLNKVVWVNIKDSISDIVKIVSWDSEGLLVIGLLELNSRKIKNSWSHKLLGWKKNSIILPNNRSIDIVIKVIEKEDEEDEIVIGAKYQDSIKDFYLNKILFENLSVLWSNTSKQQLAMLSILVVSIISLLIIVKPLLFNKLEVASNDPIVSNPLPTRNLRGSKITTLAPVKVLPKLTDPSSNDNITFNLSDKHNNYLENVDELIKLEVPKDIANVQLLLNIESISKKAEKFSLIITTRSKEKELIWKKVVDRPVDISEIMVSIPTDLFNNQEYKLIINSIDNDMKKELRQYNLVIEKIDVKNKND